MRSHSPVRDLGQMLATMKPTLHARSYCFCTTTDPAMIEASADWCLMIFREEEGVTLLLDEENARARGFDTSGPMSRIVLKVFSALDGVGLTAAVASALAGDGIACNVVAAFHHDNLFVPAADAARALAILRELAACHA